MLTKRIQYSIALFSILTFSTCLLAQEISLSFTGTYTCEYAALDSIIIENIQYGGDTVLYYPDTVLTINIAGVDENKLYKQGFYVEPNYPNPFINATKFEISIVEAGNYSVNVYDLSGREIANRKTKLGRGIHSFTFKSSFASSYVLSVNSDRGHQKILMVCAGASQNSTTCLSYNGIISNICTKSTRSNFDFSLGDELRFTGYINGAYTEITDSPINNEDYSLNILWEYDPTEPVLNNSEIGNGTILWTWEPVSATKGFKYNTTNDYNTAIDIGLTYELSQAFPTDIECGLKLNAFIWSYNDCGHSASSEFVDFKEHSITDYINGEKYNTVLVGEQCWLQENLRSSKYSNGDEIIYLPGESWLLLDYGVWAYPYDDQGNDSIYGRYYNLPAVLDERNVCPFGWHVPNNEDWEELTEYLGGSSVAGGKIKVKGTDYWESPNTGATNETFFYAYPVGARMTFGSTVDIGYNCRFWSSTFYDYTIYLRGCFSHNPYLTVGDNGLSMGFTVRCVRD